MDEVHGGGIGDETPLARTIQLPLCPISHSSFLPTHIAIIAGSDGTFPPSRPPGPAGYDVVCTCLPVHQQSCPLLLLLLLLLSFPSLSRPSCIMHHA